MNQGIYIHVPFCVSKCPYCGFNSCAVRGGVPVSYVSAMIGDIAIESPKWRGRRFATIYFGGGTPSLLSAEQAEALMCALSEHLTLDDGAEVTLECNPATVDPRSLSAFRQAGFNRLSIGVQSLVARELAALGRIHGPGEARDAIRAARAAGFDNVSADVMIGIPGQTPGSLSLTLEGLASALEHVSIYMLSVERGTMFHAMVSRGLFARPDDSLLADLYEHAADGLERGGFRRYEISNWARPGRRSEHNLIYWRRGNYLGIGAGSHSHLEGQRYSKTHGPRDYVRSVKAGAVAVDFDERLGAEQVMLEEVLLGLRTSRGLDLTVLPGGHPADDSRLGGTVGRLVEAGFAVKNGKYLALSPKGILLHDEISAEIASALSASAA